MNEEQQWWEVLFQIHEYATYPHLAQELTSSEVDFLEAVLMLSDEHSILDLGCGNGRHVLELARRGYRATGLEFVAALVEHIEEQITHQQSNARILTGDMRELSAVGTFDIVLIMNSTFGFWSDQEHQELLYSIYNILPPGGQLVLQCINPYQIEHYMQNYKRGWHQVGPGYVLRQSEFNPLLGRIETAYRYIEPEAGQAEHPGEYIRLYTYSELQRMLHNAQFQITRVFGDSVMPIEAFERSSQWQVLIAQKSRA